jgi:hypothetical protein
MQRTQDVVIRAGTVLDGSGRPPRRADVAIRDGRITSIGRVDDGGAREVNAEGLVRRTEPTRLVCSESGCSERPMGVVTDWP